jgi:hypothetical protein
MTNFRRLSVAEIQWVQNHVVNQRQQGGTVFRLSKSMSDI